MRILRDLPLRTKFLILVGVFVVAIGAALSVSALLARERMMTDRLGKLRALVEAAHSTAQSLETEVTAGRLSHAQALDRFRSLIYGMRYDNAEYLMAYGDDGLVVAHGAQPGWQGQNRWDIKDIQGRKLVQDMAAVAQKGEGATEYWYPRAAGGDPLPKRTWVKAFAPWRMFIATGVYTDDIDAEFRLYLQRIGGVLLASLLLSGGLVLLLARDITASMRSVRLRLERLAGGDHAAPVEQTDRRDEAGAMARAVEVVRQIAAEADRLRRANDEIKCQAEAERAAGLARLADDLQASVGLVADAVASQAEALQGTAGALAGSAGATKTGADAAAGGAGAASGNVQAVAAAAEELSASVDEIARRVTESAHVASAASAQVQATHAVVGELHEAAAQIGAVVALIRQIAGQTNLLALNATIEAARAGEAGRGFAVVAGEVKNLAAQTGRATEEIGGQVARIQAATAEAVRSIGGIADTVEQVNGLSAAIAAAVEQQGVATRDIAGNVARAAEATGAVSVSVQGLRGVADAVQDTSRTLLEAAGSLTGSVRSLHDRIADFLHAMRERHAAA